MRNKAISIFLTVVILFSLAVTTFAAGDPNIDGGGGGMGGGTNSNYWNPGMDGVRVSVVNFETGAVTGTPIDYTNKRPSPSYHFGKKSKINYQNGSSFTPVTSVYNYKNPVNAIPTIVNSNGQTNIAAVKRYFCSEYVTNMITIDFGISFETLTNGKYKLLLEPIVYFVFQGKNVAMTAHEAALYDQQLSGGLRSKMASLTHQNLPLAMFLERPDLGFSAYSGSTTGKQSNNTILTYLGLGTVSYTVDEFGQIFGDGTPLGNVYIPLGYDVEYRINTEVITAVTLNTFNEINPDNPASVTFNAGGRTYTMSNIVIPAGESQVVWCKWTTPLTEQDVTITVSTNKGYLSDSRIIARVVDLGKNPPPDPKADDRNDGFSAVSSPNKPQKTSARWTVWWARWHPYWVWIPDWRWHSYYGGGGYWCDHGYWEDQGWYDFFTDIYTASLTASSTVTPDNKNPTASGKTMKSGYGVNNTVKSGFTTNAPSSHVTGTQNAVSWFPEFKYDTYWRLLELITRGYSSRLEFRKNSYSTYNQRAHFSPVWYPNGNYNVYTWLIDAWTPDGMLSMNLNDSVNIQGSVFDDWHNAPKN